jgi:predicted transcriptional regulator
MGESKVFTVRVPAEIKDQLDALAENMDRSRSWIVNQAIENYISHNEWFVREVRKGLEAAERGEFASPEEVEATFRRLTGGGKLDKAG